MSKSNDEAMPSDFDSCPSCCAPGEFAINDVSYKQQLKIQTCTSCGARYRFWYGDVVAGYVGSFLYAVGVDGLPVNPSLRTMRVLKTCRRASGPAGISECICGSKALAMRCEYCSVRLCGSCGKDGVCPQCLGALCMSAPPGMIGRSFQKTLVPLSK